MALLKSAESTFKALNGVACLYKPPGIHVNVLINTVLTNICRDLNKLELRPPRSLVQIEGATNLPMNINVVADLSDSPLVVGPRYQNRDIKSSYATHLGVRSSGVFLMGINEGTRRTFHIHQARPTRAYKVHGKFGKATDNYFADGKAVEKATYKHITREKIDKVVAYMQSIHQRKMYELSGLDMDSQAGFELASMGLIRPANAKLPVLYGIKCVHFESPDFTIEIQAISEYENYLSTLIHDIGMQMKSVAHCTAIQCIRQGKFTLDHALLSKHWQLKYLLQSMRMSDELLEANEHLLRPKSAALA